MIRMVPVRFQGVEATGIEVNLPKTTLVSVSTDKGYIMCGALDVQLLNDRLSERRIIAGRAVGVKNIEQLLDAPMESITLEAEALGITTGMSGRDALLKMM